MAGTKGFWTEEDFAAAVKMRGDGRSTSEIARELGKTRNAVIGIMHRNRDRFPASKARAQTQSGRETGKPKRARHHLTTTTSRPIVERPVREVSRRAVPPDLAEAPIVETEAEPVEISAPVTFLAVTDKQCKWPLWSFPANPGGEGLCCGARIELGETYCSHHWSLARGMGTRSEQTAAALLEREAAR